MYRVICIKVYVIKHSVRLCVRVTHAYNSYTLFASPVYVITSVPPLCCKPLMFLYNTHSYIYTGLFKMIVGVLTTCHTQYT